MCCRDATSILGQFTLLDCHLHQQHKLLRPSATRVGQLNSLAKSHHPGPDLQRLSSIASATLERQVNGPMTGEWLLLTGSLPSTWPLQLQLLQLVQNNFSGTLPSTGWPAQLQVLDAQLNRLTGSILLELSCLSQLQQLRLPDNNLTGTLPAAWGGPDAFPAGLQVLQVSGIALTGTLPGKWANEKAFQEIQYLELQDTHMAGSLPQSWLLPGAFPNLRELTISALGLNGSISAGWGSHRAFQNMEILVITDARLSGHVPAFNNATLNTLILTNLGLSSGLEVFWNSSSPLALVDLANNSINGQVPDVPQALRSVVGLDLSQKSLQGTVPLSWLQAGNFLSHVSYLAQVWSKWPASVLLAIFLFHFAMTGATVAFHGFYRLVGLKYDLSATGSRFVACVVLVSLLGSPFMIPVVHLLDTGAFIGQVLKCLQHVARLSLFRWLRPGYLAAFRAHHWLLSFDYLGFSWVDYESMHNLIAACLQSLPTAILNSVLFSLGNKPVMASCCPLTFLCQQLLHHCWLC